MAIHLYLLGEKGLKVAEVALCGQFATMINRVIVGQDAKVKNDYSTDILRLCSQANVPASFHSDQKVRSSVSNTIAIAAGWRWLIKEDYRRIIVFHDSLLPKYRGFNPLVSSLLNMDELIGVSVILANEEFDRGPILHQGQLKIQYPAKLSHIVGEIAGLYAQLAVTLFTGIRNGHDLIGKTQDETRATYSVWRDNEDYRIDWNESASRIVHFINCVGFPYLGASANLDGGIVRILNAETVEDVVIENRDVGKVLFIHECCPVVICGKGLLKIIRLEDDQANDLLPLQKFRVRFR